MATTNTTTAASGHSAVARPLSWWGAHARAGNSRLQHEQDRAAEHQPRYEEQQVPLARPDQQQRSHQPAQSAGDEEQPEPRPAYLAQLAAGTPHGAGVGGKEGKGALVASATTGGTTRASSGKVISPPPPASELIRPATTAATKNRT